MQEKTSGIHGTSPPILGDPGAVSRVHKMFVASESLLKDRARSEDDSLPTSAGICHNKLPVEEWTSSHSAFSNLKSQIFILTR